jgi:uncharacterized protein YcbX
MVIDDDDDFVSQRKVPELALIVPSAGERSITLAAPGMEYAELPLRVEPDDGRVITVTVHGRPVAGQVVGEELNDWFTTFLPARNGNRRFRLVHVREDIPRYIKSRYQQPGASNRVGFSDANPILLASERSLAKLNEELERAVPMNRFRPNIVVDGDELAPYDEDYWIQLEIGSLTAFVVKACGRCVIPDIDQDTAATGKAVRRALRTREGVNAHDHSDRGVFFAQNLNHIYTPGIKVCVGDAVQVIERGTDPNVLLDPAKLNVARGPAHARAGRSGTIVADGWKTDRGPRGLAGH